MKKYVLAAAAALTLTAVPILSASAGSLDGTWLRPKSGKHVKSYSCGGGLGLKVVHSGKVIMCGAKNVGGNKYEGDLTSTDDGNTYSGTVEMGSKSMRLSGCVLGGLICKTETWKRIN
jgi:uncharacterized protein (DUF2147 family)